VFTAIAGVVLKWWVYCTGLVSCALSAPVAANNRKQVMFKTAILDGKPAEGW